MLKIPQKILVVRLSSLGDIIVMTPIFRALRERYPTAQIDYLIKTEFQSLLENNPFISNLLVFGAKSGFRGWRELCRKLAAEEYNIYIDMHNNLRSRVLGHYLRRSSLLRFRKPRLKRFFLFYFYINLFRKDFTLLSEYFKVLKPLKISNAALMPEIFLSDNAGQRADEILAKRNVHQPFVVLLAVAAWANKRYSINKYRELSRRIIEKYNVQIVWLGGKKDHYLTEFSATKDSKNIFLIGETTLDESIAILSKSSLVIGNDTGLSYAAEAVGTPLIMILGPTSRETGAGPFGPGSQSIQQQLWCRPCSQKGDRKCYRKRQYCLENISVDEIFRAAQFVLDGEKK
ncbi:MAG TPA: hypothetical protein DHW42_00665 [Candidatus Marinimicrobia bacterium]|nr:hypothetical protein [Candidatus Neomarinimicrobiota bacterium]